MRLGFRAFSIRRGTALLAVALLVCATAASAATTAHKKKPPPNKSGVTQGSTLLIADEAIYNTRTNIVTASGHVEIVDGQSQRVVIADSVSYDPHTDIVTANGHVSILEPDGTVEFGDKVELTKDMSEGAIAGFAALIGPNGRFIAVTGEKREGRYLIGHHAVFTSCKSCAQDPIPLWQVKAVRVVHDNVEKKIIYHDATFEFMGLPVFYTPYFSQADPSVKHESGLLIPSLGSKTQLGGFVRVPIYVALSDSQDFTIAPLLTTSAGAVLEGEYRERWGVGGMWLQGSIGYNQNAPQGQGPWESHLFGSGRIPINDIWQIGFDVQLTSNDTYLRRYDISDTDRLNTDLYIEGIDGRSRVAVTGYFFQGLRTTDVSGQIPFVLPMVELTYIPEQDVLGGEFRLDSDAFALYRTEGEDDQRASVSTSWRLPLVTSNGQLITILAQARGDVYHTSDALETDPSATQNSQTIMRGLALASLEWRWPFVTATAFHDTNIVLEPIVQLIASPYGGNPKGIPDEDSTSFEFNATDLFAVDAFPGLDEWEDGPRANAGVRASAILPTGEVDFIIGENYRLKNSHDFAAGSGIGGTTSDIVGQVKIDFTPYVDFTQQLRINQQTGSIDSDQIDIKAKLGRSFIDLSYLSLPPEDLGTGEPPAPRKEINLTTSINVSGNWFLFGTAIRDLEQGEMRDVRLGVTYEDECFLASLGFVRKFTVLRDLKPSSSVLLQIGLLTTPMKDVGSPF